jgi:transcriptional regulator with XRE-family HTH domain
MPDPMKLKKLIDLRRAAGKSQAEAAVYFGLAPSARNEIRRWEYGEKSPPPKYRILFIGYLSDFLNLRQDPEHFEAMWAVLEDEWEWYPLSEREREHYLAWKGGGISPRSGIEEEDTVKSAMNQPQINAPVDTVSSKAQSKERFRPVLISNISGSGTIDLIFLILLISGMIILAIIRA